MNRAKQMIIKSRAWGALDTEIHYEEALKLLKRLKEQSGRDMNTLYNLLLGSLNVKVAAFEAHLSRAYPKRGIMKLPNELLHYVFLYACDTVDDSGPEALSQVCRCFRNVATSFSDLWTAVLSNIDLFVLERRLDLSAELPLSVSLIPFDARFYGWCAEISHGHGTTWDEFLYTTSRHRHRWQSLYIDAGDAKNDLAALLKHPGSTLPSVTSLTIIYSMKDVNNSTYDQFLETWQLPNVSTLCTKYSPPPLGFFSSLTECTLASTEPLSRSHDERIDKFFNTAPNLECLIVLGGVSFVTLLDYYLFVKKLKCLPKLRSFTVSEAVPYTHLDDDSGAFDHALVAKRFHNLEIPYVEELHITVLLSVEKGIDENWDGLASWTSPFPSLKRLYITFQFFDDITLSVAEFIDKCPELEILSIEAPDHRFCWRTKPIKNSYTPNLRILHLRDCHTLSRKEHGFRKEGGDIPEIEVTNCREVDAGYARALRQEMLTLGADHNLLCG